MKLLAFAAAACCAAQQWEPLFDGKSTAGWHTQLKDRFPSEAWAIEDGALRCIGNAKTRPDLSTVRTFRNFELEFEWKIGKGVNSGVKYLVFGVRPNPAVGRIDPDVPKALGLEFQLLDGGEGDPSHSTGALYMYVAPSNVPALPLNTWHKGRIVVNGSRVEHWINGVKVMSADLQSEAVRAAVAAQKRNDVPKVAHLDELKAEPKKAYPIVLTHHGGDAWFRNMRVRVLR